MKIAGTVVWYNPDSENNKNIKTYIDYVEKLYIIDNSKKDNKKLSEELNNKKIEYIYNNGKNLGISSALNLAFEKAKKVVFEEEAYVPNEVTLQAMKEVEQMRRDKNTKFFDSTEELLKSLKS